MTHPLQGILENRDGAWVLTLVRDFRQPAEKLWPWLTDPDRLRQWSPIVPDRALDSVGPREVRENPDDEPVTGDVVSVDPPHELVHRWGDDVGALAPFTDRHGLPADAGAHHARAGPCRDERRRLASLPRRAGRRRERCGPAAGGRSGRRCPRVGSVARQVLRCAGGLGLGLRAVEHRFDVVAVRVTDERAEVAGVILRPEPRRVQ